MRERENVTELKRERETKLERETQERERETGERRKTHGPGVQGSWPGEREKAQGRDKE